MTFKDKVKNFFIKNCKLMLFILIFALICLIYNQNNQSLNYVLKRGIVLEYSVKNDAKINKEEIKNKLLELNIKYSFIDEADKTKFETYDFDNEIIKKTLYIALPIMPQPDKADIINNISDYIFDNYDAKLISTKTLNDNYNKPYNAFLKFLSITFITLIIQWIILYLFCDSKKIINNLKESITNFFAKKKEEFSLLIKKTKEKGVGYFIKRLLFDENDSESETSLTKEIITTIVFVLLCVIAIRYFIGELRWIPSGSMRPTILEHDRVFVEKLKYPKKEIERGDILVFYPPGDSLSNSPFAIFARLSGIFCKDIAFIKRAVGMPGDKLEIKFDGNNGESRVYINDEALNEPYINSRMNWTPCTKQMYCGPFTIPKGHYFMMGDNRGNSQDSRFWGFLDENRVIGRANFMFFPISRINLMRDKYLKLHKEKTKDGIKEYNYIIDRYEFLYKI